MSTNRDPTARLRAGLNPLLTSSLGSFHSQSGTPLSAVSMASPHPFSPIQTPASAIQPYNPQEWVASPVSGPERLLHHSQEPQCKSSPSLCIETDCDCLAHPFQASPPPPPPYSPPRGPRPASSSFEPQPANVSAARAPPPLRVSPETPASNMTFAPPPNASGRGPSRERRFGLPSFGRRKDPDKSNTPIEAPSTPHPLSVSRPHPQPGPLTLQIPAGPQRTDSDASQSIPPSARRAVSSPAVTTPTSARSRSSSQVRWGTTIPLPPPPPGPPPSASRSQSQSANRPCESAPITSPPTRRPPPDGVAALGPVPPTPADWVERASAQPRGQSPPPVSLVSETGSIASSNAQQPETSSTTSTASSAGGLARARALRGEKTLRERRNDSRTRTDVYSPADTPVDPNPLSDIVVPPASGLTRRLTINKGTPRSARSNPDTPRSGELSSDYSQNAGSTPRAPQSSSEQATGSETPTPPFSPRPQKSNPAAELHHSAVPKALPTPPPQSRSSSGSTRPAADIDFVSSSPRQPLTRQAVIAQSPDQFLRGTVERFKLFAQREAVATDEAEKVRLFSEFFVNESRIRRERYSNAIRAMGSEIFDLSRDLFRPMAPGRESTTSTASPAELTPQSSKPTPYSVGSAESREAPTCPPSASSSSTLPMSPVGPSPGNLNWQSSNYMPSLSPILSMSVSDAVDEEDSRGRPASRWWESDSAGDGSTRLERSKRESKYMGVPKEAREALQWLGDDEAGPSKRDSSNTYPNEKSGWHEESVSTPQPFSSRSSLPSIPSPNTPNQPHLDVSRLVTLPPPYPRHHPAVNNSHPELTQIRTAVRAISDMTEVNGTKERFLQSSTKMRAEYSESAKQRARALRANLQQEISAGNLGYADAAAIEADAKADENAKAKEVEKKDFDVFQTSVVMPLNELLSGRIAKATALFDELQGRLFVETREPDPNMPQEEGDEQPELLERLTLLKWIFEAREMLHRTNYDLLSDRNDRYREMVLTPYRLSNNADKIASATAFFAEDAQKRAQTFSEEVLCRTEAFRDVVDETVVRGVEAQLGAFWDIAPPLRRVLDKIPADLHDFRVQIPAGEYDENPAYVDHPLQYLYSLLLHAEKSTYQFIESQTNLLCLLHEVNEAVAVAKSKVVEHDGRNLARAEAARGGETRKLTEDLKEKVRVVQEQWETALGYCIRGVKERVGEWLLETGGWDESFEDGGVGGVQI